MEKSTQTIYNDWYWENLAQPALKKLLDMCKMHDKNLLWEANQKDCIPALKYLKNWEEKNPGRLDKDIKEQLKIVRNIENYQEIISE